MYVRGYVPGTQRASCCTKLLFFIQSQKKKIFFLIPNKKSLYADADAVFVFFFVAPAVVGVKYFFFGFLSLCKKKKKGSTTQRVQDAGVSIGREQVSSWITGTRGCRTHRLRRCGQFSEAPRSGSPCRARTETRRLWCLCRPTSRILRR